MSARNAVSASSSGSGACSSVRKRAELGVLLVADWPLERDRHLGASLDPLDLLDGMSSSSAISSVVGSRYSSVAELPLGADDLVVLGRRCAPACGSCGPCRRSRARPPGVIHHVAYVENLKPRRQSNFSTARTSPIVPSWMRSRNGRPWLRYRFAIETTRRRFASIISCFARRSPASIRFASSTSRAAVRS